MTREDVIREFETRHPIYACRREMADEIVKLRAQLAGVRERATPDVVRILRLLSDEKSRPITLHIGYGQQLAAMADALAALDGAA